MLKVVVIKFILGKVQLLQNAIELMAIHELSLKIPNKINILFNYFTFSEYV